MYLNEGGAPAPQGEAGQPAGAAASPAVPQASEQQQAASAGQESASLLQLLEGETNITPEENQAISRMLVKLDAQERKDLLPKFMSKALSKRMKGSREREATLQASIKEYQEQLAALKQQMESQQGQENQLPEGLEDLDEQSRTVALKLHQAYLKQTKALQERLDAIERPQKEKNNQEKALAYIQEMKAIAPYLPDFAVASHLLMKEEGGGEAEPLMDYVELQGEWLDSFGRALQDNNPAIQAAVLKYVEENYSKDSGFVQALLNKLIPLYREGKLQLVEQGDAARPAGPGPAGERKREPQGVWALT